MSAMLTGNWAEFVNGVSARIDEIIDETKDMGPSFQQSGLWRTEQSDDAQIYRTNGVTGLKQLELFEEGDSIKEDTSSKFELIV